MAQTLPRSPRQVVRLVLFDPLGRILLVKHEDAAPADPSEPDTLRYWVLPGGGQERNETTEDAVKRELFEETGIRATRIGPCVWVRRGRLLSHGKPQPYIEHYFLAFAGSDTPPPRSPDPTGENIVDVRWWSLPAIADSHETFFPSGLVDLVTPLATGDVPEAPFALS